MPQAGDGPGRPTPKRKVVKKKSVGDAISKAGKGKKIDFGPKPVKPKPGTANAGVGAKSKGTLKKKNPRTASDPHPNPKLKRAGVLPSSVGINLSPAGKTAVAPVLKVLDVAARPLYAAANAKKQELINQGIGDPGKKGSVIAAAGRGLKGEEKTLYSDVYKQAGVKNKTVAAILGTGTDIAVSGLYPGARGGSLSRSGAEVAADKAVRRVTKKVAKGVRPTAPRPAPVKPKPKSPEAAKRQATHAKKDAKAKAGFTPEDRKVRFQNMAADRAEREAKKKRGVWVGVGYGKHGQIRISRRSDRTLMGKPREPSKLGVKVSNAARGVIHQVRPMVRSNSLSSLDDHARVQDIQREQRAISQKGLRDAQDRYDALERAIPVEHRPAIMAAMEAESVRGLPDELKPVGSALIAAARHRNRLRKRAGFGGDVTKTVKLPAVKPDVNASRSELAAARRAEREARTAERRAGRRVGKARVREAEARGVARTRVEPKDRAKLASYLAAHENHPFSTAMAGLRDARKERQEARKAFGNRARYNNQGLFDTSGAAARKAKAEAAYVAAKKRYDDEYAKLLSVAEREFAKKQAGKKHDGRLAWLGRGEKGSLERYADRAADVAGEESVLKAAVAAVKPAAERTATASKRHVRVRAAQADYRRRVRLRDGDTGTRPKGFAPHIRERDLLEGKVDDPFRRPTTGGSGGHKRKIHRTVADHNSRVDAEGRFAEDVPAVWATYEMKTARAVADRTGAVEARGVGRPLPQGKFRLKVGRGAARATKTKGHVPVRAPKKTLTPTWKVDGVKPHETVVHVGERVTPLTDDQVRALAKGDRSGFKGGQFRVMSTEHAVQLTRVPAQSSGKWARGVVRPWKAVATATPQFQLRNLVGDEARLFDSGVPLAKMPGLNRDAAKQIGFVREHGSSFGSVPDGAMVDLGKSGVVSQKQLMAELHRNGVISSGIRTGELTHIGGDAQKLYGRKAVEKADSLVPSKVVKRVTGVSTNAQGVQAIKDIWREAGREAGHPLHNLAKVLQDRENLTYIASYLHHRRAGLSERDATRKTMDALIDYGNITDVERMLRNSVFPFYTFQSRVVPFYAKTLVQRPGKIAAYEAVRQELGKAMGMPADNLTYEAMYRQRTAGFPIAGKWVSDGLPFAQGLNELPTTLNMKEYARELFRYTTGSMAPWVKSFPELAPVVYGAPGYNFFFEAPLESPNSRFSVAPVIPGVPWDKVSEASRRRLGVKKIEMRDGSIVWGWRGWKSYVLNIVTPGAPGFALRAGQEVSRRGQNKTQQWVGFLTGVKIDNPDKIGAAIGNAYTRKDLLEGLRSDLGQEPGGRETAQYQLYNKRILELSRLINALSRKRGDKKPLGTPPKKGRVKKVNQSNDPLGLNSSGATDSDPLGLNSGTSSDSDPLGLN